MAMGKGTSLRSGGRTQSAAPAMSAVRGRTASRSSSANSAVSTPMGGGRTAAGRFHASGNSVNLGERYVSRGSLSATASPSRQTAAGGRTAYSNGGTFRRPSGVSAEGFRSPFESRSQSYSRSSFNTGRNTAGYNRSTAVNSSRSSFNRSYNSSSRSSYSTGSYSRSSMSGGRSYGGGGSVRGGGGGRR